MSVVFGYALVPGLAASAQATASPSSISGALTPLNAGATVTPSPSSITWGAVAIGNAGGQKVATLSNSGPASVTISNIAFTGANPGDFSIFTKTCGTTLAASASCTANILFKPTANGVRTATLTFSDTGNNSPQTLSVSGTGTGGVGNGTVSASPSSITWGSVAIGNAGGQKVATLTNSGTSSVTISNIAYTGANPGDFSIFTKTCGTSLAASASCTANILFKPTANGLRTATLTFSDSASNSPQTIAVSGTGTGGTGGTVSASPASLSFGSVNVGSTSGSQAITVTNGTASAVTLSTETITGANASEFSVTSTTCGSSLAASASCAANIVFKPTTASAAGAAWNLTASGTPLSVALTGTGTTSSTGGTLAASPSSITWGSVAVGNAGGQKVATLTNSGTSSVTISNIAYTGANPGDFSIFTKTCGSSLAASASCTANILFKPTANGVRTATLTFTDSASNSPQTISVSGTGTGGSGNGTVSASPTSLSFGTVTNGTTSGAQVITVSNGTTSSVSLGAGALSGTNAAEFAISSTTCGSTLAASGSCTANIVFKPTATGAASASWTMQNITGGTTLTVTMSGTGATGAGTVSASPTSLSFGTVTNGTTSGALAITVSNGTTSSVSLGTGALSGTNAAEFAISSTTCGSSLAASGSCTASIVFKPTATGAASASWTMKNNTSGTTLTVSLSGTGSTTSSGGAGTVSPTTLNFGSYAVNSTSGTRLITFTNNGTSSVTVSNVVVSGTNAGDFDITVDGCKSGPISKGDFCNVDMIYAPTVTGAETATLTFTDTATNSPQTVALSGTGTPPPTTSFTISPSSQTWTSQAVGSAAASKTFTVTAGGSGSATIDSISLTSTDPQDFSIASKTCGASLAAGSSCTVTVGFKPTAIGDRVALLTLVDTAIGGTQSAEVSGLGAYSASQTASVTVDFGSRSGSQVSIPANILGTEYFESLPTNANRTTVVQAGFTSVRYRLEVPTVFPTSATAPTWAALNGDMQKFVDAGVHPYVELEGTPVFLQPSPSCNGDATTNVPTNVTQWGQLAAQIVAHLDSAFPGLINTYEIWNEPNTTALCPDTLAAYITIFQAAAPAIQAQGKADGVTLLTGGAATAGVGFPSLMTNPATYPYMDFYSYHIYEGSSTDIKNGMTWDGAGGTPSLYSKVMDPSSGLQARYLQAWAGVKVAKSPQGANTPIYFDEYNDDWAFLPDCCRNSPIYSPLFNSLVVAQMFNSVYHGAGEVPAKLIYFSAAQPTFCILGIVNAAMDCNKAATGAQAQPYPQYYAYELMFAKSFLDMQDGGHMASSITLSSGATSEGLIATGYYTATTDSILIINPTGSSFSGVTLQVNNPGFTSTSSTLFTINAANPTVSSWPASTISVSGGIQTTFDLPPYSVIGIAVK